jgi:hypothetical protein
MSGPILGVVGPPLTGYYLFLRRQMGIPVEALPDDSPYIPGTFNASLDIVNIYLSLAPQVGDPSYPSQYAYAVYNLAGDRMINFAQDDPNNPFIYPGSDPPTPYFQYLRQQFKIDAFVSGVVTYAADLTTSASFMVADWIKNMSMFDLQTLKTPWGRTYMGIAQQYGPTIVDIT